jgi:hypothetical protein
MHIQDIEVINTLHDGITDLKTLAKIAMKKQDSGRTAYGHQWVHRGVWSTARHLEDNKEKDLKKQQNDQEINSQLWRQRQTQQ